MNEPHAAAEKAAREIDQIDRRGGTHNQAWLLHVTAAVQAAIDAETKPLVEALRIALGYWRPCWSDMVEEPEEAADGLIYNKCIAALAPFEKGSDAK